MGVTVPQALILVHTPSGDAHISAERARALGIRPGDHITWEAYSDAQYPRTRGPHIEPGWFELLWRWVRG